MAGKKKSSHKDEDAKAEAHSQDDPLPREKEVAATAEKAIPLDHTALAAVEEGAKSADASADGIAAELEAEKQERATAPEKAILDGKALADADGGPHETVSKALHARARARQRARGGKQAFPIVGVGASAGGLEALQEFFSKMPRDTGMAFVVVTHLHPEHVSLLPELISKYTAMKVQEVRDDLAVAPNNVYVMRPARLLKIREGRLHLVGDADGSHVSMPIDHFFRSLASDHCENAICVILSGTGSDGTLGMRSIKAEAGMAMVQLPSSAKYPGMPTSAADTGLADYILPPSDMGRQLVSYVNGPFAAGRPAETTQELNADTLRDILMLLRGRSGHDFTGYKMSTIKRRIERRMNVHQIQNPRDYIRYCQENSHELDMLFTELLISVTSFFRDPDAFQSLQRHCVPQLVQGRESESSVRVWVPGCCTGEEAYSLAIILHECMEKVNKRFDVQVFGTDLDPHAIETARAGIYSAGIAVDVPSDRLERYFVRQDNIFRIRKEIREMLVFAPQNLIKDPPFTKLDMIACRNVLIYLDVEMQRRVLAVFHYALRPGGLLFLGPSETMGTFRDYFDIIDAKWKIFRRREGSTMMHPLMAMPADRARPDAAPVPTDLRVTNTAANIQRLLLGKFAPPTVVTDDHGNIVYIHGRTGLYLEPSQGQPRSNIFEMAREGLAQALVTAVRRAAADKAEVTRERVQVKTNGSFAEVNLSVSYITAPEVVRGLLMVTFTQPEPAPTLKTKRFRQESGATRVEEVERELQYTRESLQTTIEELETSNEELKSTNEELQSTNEELQSTNEELETSKEELQSLNEELATVNAELQSKLDELALANSDMQNLLNNTQIATIFLDAQLNVKRYTERATEVFNLIASDVGRPLGDLTSRLAYDRLLEDCKTVLRSLMTKQVEVKTRDGALFWMRIMPYRTIDNVIDGVVITFIDFNRFRSQDADRAFLAEFIELSADPVVLLDGALRVYKANMAFYRFFGLESSKVEGHGVAEADNSRWCFKALRGRLRDFVEKQAPLGDWRVEQDLPGAGKRALVIDARRVTIPLAGPDLVLLTMRDAHGTQ